MLLDTIKSQLSFPVFVKPSHCGSSVGITKVTSSDGLETAIQFAFHFDTIVLVENGIAGRELEFAVLGNEEITVFPPGEILTYGKVYDYHAKYDPDGIKAIPCAVMSDLLIEEGKELAALVYRTMRCSGLARVDFFLDENNVYWFNEINTMPGFTATSLYPEMCAANGLSGEELMDRLVILAMHRRRRQQRIDRGLHARLNQASGVIEYMNRSNKPEEAAKV